MQSIDELLRASIRSILKSRVTDETVEGIIEAVKDAGLELFSDIQYIREEDLRLVLNLKVIPCRILVRAWSDPNACYDQMEEELADDVVIPSLVPIGREPVQRRLEYFPTLLPACRAIKVSNLPDEICRDSNLIKLFRPFGRISHIRTVKNEAGQPKGSAFITYHRQVDAVRAKEVIDGFEYNNKTLRVDWAKGSRS